MAELVPAIHVPMSHAPPKTWMPGFADRTTAFFERLWPSMTASQLPQRLFQEILQLRLMLRHLADRGRGRRRPPGIARPPVLGADLVEHPFQKDVDEHPAALVARLLLAPDDLRFLEARQLGHQRLGGKRIELLDAQQINIVDAAFLALVVEIVIDLARTNDDAPDFWVGHELGGVVRHLLRI